MAIDKETVRYIAHLARIAIDDEELEYYAPQLTKILEYIAKIGELNLDDTPEMSVHAEKNVYQEDEAHKFENTKGLMAIIPRVESQCIKVPKIID